MTVNDPFVTAAWGEANHADGKVKMLADTHLDFTKVCDCALAAAAAASSVNTNEAAHGYLQGMGLVLDAEGMLGNKRSKRCVCAMHACRQGLLLHIRQRLAVCVMQVLCHR